VRRRLLEAGEILRHHLKAASYSKIELAKSINIGLEKVGRKCCFKMKVIFVQEKHSRVFRIRKVEQLSPAY